MSKIIDIFDTFDSDEIILIPPLPNGSTLTLSLFPISGTSKVLYTTNPDSDDADTDNDWIEAIAEISTAASKAIVSAVKFIKIDVVTGSTKAGVLA